MADDELIRTRIGAFLQKLPQQHRGLDAEGQQLLTAAGERLGGGAKPFIRSYLKSGDPWRRFTVCEVLRITNQESSIELLAPFLEDKRRLEPRSHQASERNSDLRQVITRVCDAAAETLSLNHPELKFKMIGTERELDEQIRILREQLARRKR
jgi:hypothetical protein